MILGLRAEDRRYFPKKNAPQGHIRGACVGVVSEDALFGGSLSSAFI